MSSKRIIDLAGDPRSIKRLTVSQMKLLCGDVRKMIIDTVSKNGGHLASNLGVVELTVAMLHCFDVPNDKIVWDVGHQCYAYKILTDRRERFNTLRQQGGISGFPKAHESRFDSFISGHASTSLAAAFGIKTAMSLANDKGHVVAVIGDGSLTGGMAYEGLNNIGKSRENLIIVVNDNEMAISKNEGAVAKHLSTIRSKPEYFKMKKTVEKMLLKVPLAGETLRDVVAGSKTILKQVIYPSTFFEELGFTYFGPVDGHNLQNLCDIFTEAKKCDGPSIIHVQTKKGKGYRFAEENPGAFHGVSKFDVRTGEPLSKSSENFSSVFGHELVSLAEKDDRICAITAAMEHGTGLQHFGRRFKDEGRFFDVGIAEEFGVTFAAGMAAGDRIPVFAIYSTFLQRGYDQLVHDAAIEKRHIVFGIDRAGVVGDDGETHQGVFDAAFLSTVPNFTVYAPCNYMELRYMLKYAVCDFDGPIALRYPRGSEDKRCAGHIPTGESFDVIKNGGKTAIVTYGRTFAAAKEAAEKTDADVIKLNRIVPIDEDAVKSAMGYQRVVFAEEGVKNGGIGMQFLAKLALNGYKGETALRAIEGFVQQSSVDNALKALGLDSDSLIKLIDG